MVIVAAVMLAYNWQLALIAFVVSMPLAFVLRAVQSRLRAWPTTRPATPTATCSARSPKSCRARRRSAPTGPAKMLEPTSHEAVEVKTRGTDQRRR